jgi:hypothetical protein
MRKLRLPILLAAAASLLAALPVSAGDSTLAPTYGIRVYEVFQRGPSLELQERTTRTFAPKHVRNIAVGEIFPAEDQPAMKVYASRDHLGYYGSYWREDGSSADFGKYKVEVIDEGPADESGVWQIRVRLVPHERGAAATRRVRHPEFQATRDEKGAMK